MEEESFLSEECFLGEESFTSDTGDTGDDSQETNENLVPGVLIRTSAIVEECEQAWSFRFSLGGEAVEQGRCEQAPSAGERVGSLADGGGQGFDGQPSRCGSGQCQGQCAAVASSVAASEGWTVREAGY